MRVNDREGGGGWWGEMVVMDGGGGWWWLLIWGNGGKWMISHHSEFLSNRLQPLNLPVIFCSCYLFFVLSSL